jgi:NDP-sugar pyrophosphorylase family protein
MVLAAGRGERLRPLSDVLPKPAMPLPDGPLIVSSLRLAASVAESVVVNTWHLGQRMMETVVEDRPEGVELHLSPESRLMGTAGGLALARDRGLLGRGGPVMVINGDGVLDLDLEALSTRHHREGDEVTLALLPHPDPEQWSRVLLDDDGRVVAIRGPGSPEASEHSLLYPGVMLVSRRAIDRLPSGFGEAPDRLWWPAQERGALGGALVSGRWAEAGTPKHYLSVVVDQLAGEPRTDRSATVDSTATITTSLIGRNAVVRAGAVIEESVVAEGATIGAGAHIRRCVVLGSVELPDGAEVIGDFLAKP